MGGLAFPLESHDSDPPKRSLRVTEVTTLAISLNAMGLLWSAKIIEGMVGVVMTAKLQSICELSSGSRNLIETWSEMLLHSSLNCRATSVYFPRLFDAGLTVAWPSSSAWMNCCAGTANSQKIFSTSHKLSSPSLPE